MIETEHGCCLEAESRRRGWASDRVAVRLADNALWHLPAISPALLKFTPDLRDDLRGVLAVTIWDDRPAGADQHDADGLVAYCDRMGAVARRLLAVNYDLPDYTWRALMTFNDNVGLYNMLMGLSLALDDAWVEWRPWLDTA